MDTDRQHVRILRELNTLSRLTDTAFRVPGTRIRFGWDALIGLIPGGGDAVGLVVSLYILFRARQLRTPLPMLVRMAANILIDALVGAVPIAGDAFDVYFKANRRNLAILLQHYPDRANDIS